jgi:hypothetical protein
MSALREIEQNVRRLGYRTDAILKNYSFNDFSPSAAGVRSARLAVFSQTPASYRSAVFGVAEASSENAQKVVDEHRSLGAPLFFVIESGTVSVWQVFGSGPSRFLERTKIGLVDELFNSHMQDWTPESIHRAKSIGKFDSAYQLDFVDAGLLPAIEGEIHSKLDRLLEEVFGSLPRQATVAGSERHGFRTVFRLLAAKILVDREHVATKDWKLNDVGSIIQRIAEYYKLSTQDRFISATQAKHFASAWDVLRNGLNVANISADDLAYVYENTLVTPDTREAFSTHSTPRQVAEYIAARLRLWSPDSVNLRVYEPFCGAGVLMVAALRHMRAAMPSTWNDRKKHEHLVEHLRGSEIDSFACEVATLSLILADYPNTNGWKIDNRDLFTDGSLSKELESADVILCNPPFAAFDADDKSRYSKIAAEGGNKAEAVLRKAIQSPASSLGFVLPRAFLMDRAYKWHRRELEARFSEIELVSLPDGVFRESVVECALLIARAPASAGVVQKLRSSEVFDRDRKQFLSMGRTSSTRSAQRVIKEEPAGKLWLSASSQIWESLAGLPTLGGSLEGHWGVRWNDGYQSMAESPHKKASYEKGLMHTRSHRQFALGPSTYLDMTPSRVYGAGDLPWDKPKILCNAGRSSRGSWRICAAVDRAGLVASQQYVGLWPFQSDLDLDAYTAIINSPLANAYLDQHSADRRLRISTLLSTPIPRHIPEELGAMAREYSKFIAEGNSVLQGSEALQKLLDEIDECVLRAYELPLKQVRNVLANFRNQARPVVHEWRDWGVSESDAAFSISELRGNWTKPGNGHWPRRELPPISGPDAKVLADLLA